MTTKKRTGRRRSAQLEIRYRTWGGRRAGAGRKRKGTRRRVPHRVRAALASRYPVHVTIRLKDGLPRLRGFKPSKALKRALVEGCKREGFRICQFSVQQNHLHLICEAKSAGALSRGIQGFNVRVARRLNRLWGREGAVVDGRYHAEVLKTPRQTRNALCYVLQNGRRHGWRPSRKMAERFGPIDPFSSAWYFDGWRDPGWRRGVTPPDPDEGVPVAKSRAWLLTTGWRIHRLIDVFEVPSAGRRAAPRR